MPFSPQTQQFQAGSGGGVDQSETMFEQGFSQMAYATLGSKLPELLPDVVTFKVIDTDMEQGVGVGVFVVVRSGKPLYIPVVLCDNALKPLELVYDKSLNVFLPLTKGWLAELDKTKIPALGQGIKTPESLYTDVDLRNIVVPPMTGRFSYAEDASALFTVAQLEKTASEPAKVLIEFLGKAPNAVKQAFHGILSKNPGLLKHAAETYGVTALRNALALHVVKTAAKQLHGGALWIADKDTPMTEFKRMFGDKAGEAYSGVRRKGYAESDKRLQHNLALKEQPFMQWMDANQPGIYKLMKVDGKDVTALVIPQPVDVSKEPSRYGKKAIKPAHNPLIDDSYVAPGTYRKIRSIDGRPNDSDFATRPPYQQYLAILANGDYVESPRVAGTPSMVDDLTSGPLYKRLFENVEGSPKAGKGVFVRQKGTSFQSTCPLEIKAITTDSGGERRITFKEYGFGYDDRVMVTNDKSPYGGIHVVANTNLVFLPPDFIWIPLKEQLNNKEFFTSPAQIQEYVNCAMLDSGAKKVTLKDASAGQFSINGSAGLGRVDTLRKVATDFGLKVAAVDELLTQAAETTKLSFWVVSPSGLAQAQLKLGASDESGSEKKKPAKKAPPKGDADPGDEDPSQGGGDPSMDPNAQAMMAQQAAPPQPSPAELAALEMDQQIQQEMQKLQEKQMMLAQLTQRTQEIASGAPVMPTAQTQAMGAPPLSQNLASGAPMPGAGMGQQPPQGLGEAAAGAAMPGMAPPGAGMDPSQGMGEMPPGAGMDPSQGMGGMPPAGGMDPSQGMGGMPPGGGMDPSQGMGGMPPGGGMDPSQGMGGDPSMQQGMQPGMQPQMPSAMMGPDGLDSANIMSQINPRFLQGAAGLPSPEMFDAAAVASLAQSPQIRELVGQYLPNLEKAVDNLGRVLLSLEMQEPHLKEEIGEAAFSDLEEKLRGTFRGLGDLVLHLSQSAHVMSNPYEQHAAG